MKKLLKYSLIALVWIGLWQLIAMTVGHELLFPTPWAVAVRLGELMITLDFYRTVALSLLRIVAGIVAGVLIGILGGILTAFSKLARDFFAPALAVDAVVTHTPESCVSIPKVCTSSSSSMPR